VAVRSDPHKARPRRRIIAPACEGFHATEM
jgi:hypothetical protein